MIDGIHNIEYHRLCIDRENRYNLMICIDMIPEALGNYDKCGAHKKWKETYSSYIESKAIFDGEF